MKNIFSNRKLALGQLIIAAGLFATSCENIEYPEPKPVTVADKGVMRVVNACPGARGTTASGPTAAPIVDGAIDNLATAAIGNANMTLGTTAAATIDAGRRQIRFINKATNASLVASEYNLLKNNNFTVFLTDSINRVGGPRQLQVSDALTAPAAGRARVRFFNLAPNASSLGLFLGTSTTATFSTRSYRTTTNFTTFTELNAGVNDLFAKTSGTAAATASLLNFNFEAGKIYTLYVSGLVGGTGAQSPRISVIVHN